MLDSSDLLAWRRPLSILLRSVVFLLEMSLLAIVIISNVGLVLIRTRVPLVSIYIYRPAIVPISRADVVPLLLIVRAGYGKPGHPTLSLLLARELAIVNTDRYSDILVEGIGSVYLI